MGQSTVAEMPPQHTAAHLTRNFIRAIDHYRQRVATTLGTSVTELVAMGDLYQRGQLTPTELADRLGITTGSVTALVDRLIDAGYVERKPNPEDRRSLLVCLTASGRRGIAPSYDGLITGSARALESATPRQHQAILGYLQDAADAFDSSARSTG